MLLTALLPLGGSPASACAQPAEGEPTTCCPPQYLVEIDNGVVYLGVPDPTQRPCYTSS